MCRLAMQQILWGWVHVPQTTRGVNSVLDVCGNTLRTSWWKCAGLVCDVSSFAYFANSHVTCSDKVAVVWREIFMLAFYRLCFRGLLDKALCAECSSCNASFPRSWRKYDHVLAFRSWQSRYCVLIWIHSTVGRTPVFGRRTDPVLCSACSRRVTTMWVNCPLQVSQLGQFILSSFRGR